MKTTDQNKRYLLPVALAAVLPVAVWAQSGVTLPGGDLGQNYITSAVMTQPVSSGAVTSQNAVIRTDYFDGLGRPLQAVAWRAAGNKDLADFRQYNERGKLCRSWLPTATVSGDGSFTPLSELENHYASRYPDASVYYSTAAYEATPAADVSETRAPGAWQSADGERTKHLVSGGTGYLAAMWLYVGSDGAMVKSGNRQAGELLVTEVTDEDGKKTLEFTDKDGHTVLHRSVLGGAEYADTYMVYDIYGNLCYVLPPMASFHIQSMSDGTISDNNEWLSKYCYLYKWDHRNRMTEKRLPGCEPVYLVYDKCDQLVYSQDGKQRSKNLWTLSTYDVLGRIAYTAQVSDTRTVDQLRQAMASVSPRVSFSASGTVFGYSGTGNATGDDILSVNYYDSYDFLSNFAATGDSLAYQAMSGYDEKYVADVPSLSARGMLTGTATRVLGDTTMLVRSLYYDHHGNVIQSHETNALGGAEHTYSHLTFTGKPLQVMQVHTTADTTLTDVYSYTYDNMERLLTASVAHDGGTAVQLAANTYDELGRLASRQLGGTAAGLSEYAYNVRGWTTAISNPNFSQTLHYQDEFTGATPCYNGNISAMEWQARDAMMAAAPTRHHYSYSYDGLNRLTAASHGTTDAATWSGHLAVPAHCPRNYSCSYQYDSNGNLTALTRKGVSQVTTAGTTTVWQYGTIDDLSLTYDGNRLKKVADQCADLTYEGAMDFSDGANRATEYTYDANGNMTSDANKGISRITYNVLNLPQEVTFADGHIIRYRYAADGRKLRTDYVLSNYTVIDNPGGPSILHSGGAQPMGGGTFTPGDGLPDPENQLETTLMVRNYCGNHIYRDGALERIMGDYGYMDGTGNYHYFIKDYLGNVRAVIDQQGTLEEVNNYYPYGALLGGGTVGGNQGVQPYKYGTKELDRQNGLDWYDSQARMYDPVLGRTPTMDPKAEDYASISPYAWCAGNPIFRVDLKGENFYSVNPTGYFTLLKETEDQTDRIFASDGTIVNYNNYIDVSKSFFASEKSEEIMTSSTARGTEEVVVYVYNSDDARNAYNFLIDNTEVEWSYADSSKGQFLGTTHSYGQDSSQSYMAKLIHKKGGEATEFRHSHPNMTLTLSESDVSVAGEILRMHPNTNFFVDCPITKESRQYNSSSEFNTLREITITPTNTILKIR